MKDQETFPIFGMQLQIMGKLPQGYMLVAHKNGPGIAKEGLLACLESFDEEIPEEVRHQAIRKLADWCSKQATYPGHHLP